MPPQNKQPENIAPSIPTPESSIKMPTFGEVMAKQAAETAPEGPKPPEVAPVAEKPIEANPALSQPLLTAENTTPMPPDESVNKNVHTPKELVRKFEVIEGMADDPFAEQEAFKKAQSEYLASLGENLENAA
jgi:hypothetical protein